MTPRNKGPQRLARHIDIGEGVRREVAGVLFCYTRESATPTLYPHLYLTTVGGEHHQNDNSSKYCRT